MSGAVKEGAPDMAVEQTLSIIKPDATRRNLTGAINARLEEAGLRIVAQKRIRLSREQAEAFYDVHKERPFYDSLCDFMTSGPVVVQVLEAENAVALNREVMGATNPADADAGHHQGGSSGIPGGQLGPRLGLAGQRRERSGVLFLRWGNRRLVR